MKITIISLGKVKEAYFKDAIDEYSKRLNKFCTFQSIELPDEKISSIIPDQVIKDREAEKILKALNDSTFIIAMTEIGKHLTSVDFSKTLEDLKNNGNADITFIIGGALGLSDQILKKANLVLSLSKMTMPHQMAKMFLTEQIFRAFKIMNNEPYHK